jgi:hypothetical protein
MTLAQIILSALLALPRFSLDTESDSERLTRLGRIAVSIDQATLRAVCAGVFQTEDCKRTWMGTRRQLAAAMVSLGWHESKYAQAIGEGRCHDLPKGMQCDNGHARGYWQSWKVACPAAWQVEHGSPTELSESSWCAARLLSSAYRFCSDWEHQPDPWARAFGRYAGRGCSWIGGPPRVRTMRRVLASFDRPVLPSEVAKND